MEDASPFRCLQSKEIIARRLIMIRVTTIAAVVALAVSAAPASAATSSSGTGVGRVGGKMHLEDVSLGTVGRLD
jgi:hypothetical protein